ncbi:MAG: ECF transporter S component [Clostridia bacterium]|nr:ECF transporter S component [Clostridia bacterium]
MNKTKRITTIAMLSSIAYIFTLIGHFLPIYFNDFLRYDPKDAIIAISGFTLGPLSALIISVAVSVLEAITISTTGIIGCLMNILSSATFACVSAFIYKRIKSINGALAGLILSSLLTVGAMLLWNYLVTPAYMKVPREAVEAMLVPVFLPFNFIKCCLNSALTMLLYKPCVNAMRRVGLVPRGEGGVKYSIKPWVIVCSVAVIALMIVLFICLKS